MIGPESHGYLRFVAIPEASLASTQRRGIQRVGVCLLGLYGMFHHEQLTQLHVPIDAITFMAPSW